jgi:diguanylate cyclase (GGDEF)-like protein
MNQSIDCDICKSNELRSQVSALEDLIDVARVSVSTIDLDDLLQAILMSALRFTGIPAGSVALYDQKKSELTLRAHCGLSEAFVERSTWPVKPGGLTDQLLKRDEILFVEDTEQVSFFNNPLAVNEGIRSLICIPLVSKGAIQGVLYLDDFVPRAFDKERMKLISVVASFAAMAIENATLHHETRQMAITDLLTGLYNRRYFEQVLTQELTRAKRYKLTCCLLILDVDNFKNFNDTFGHPMGDRILATIGETITKMLRSVDFAFRYGGEEFAIILPETDLNCARDVAERIRRCVIEDSGKIMRDTQKELVTVSTGIACYPHDAVTGETLFAVADRLLYKAKDSGKNRTLCHEGESE